jgi:hypothetical protein
LSSRVKNLNKKSFNHRHKLLLLFGRSQSGVKRGCSRIYSLVEDTAAGLNIGFFVILALHSGSILDIIKFFFFFSTYILILIYLMTFWRKLLFVSNKMWKIGPWRSLRIFSAKVDFPRFMYYFGRFSALTQNLDTVPHGLVTYIFGNL